MLFEKKISHVLSTLPYLVGQEAVNFFVERLTAGVNVRNVPLKKRKFETQNRKGRALLIKSGALRRSIRITQLTAQSVTVTSDLPYSQIHNEGGEIPVTPKMRKFFWAKFYETSGKLKTQKSGAVTLANRRNQQLSQEAMFWRALALKKKNSPIKIPKRQFMGESKFLEMRLKTVIEKELQKAFQ